MPKNEQFCIVIPTRNAPERCVEISQKLSHAARMASFDYALKILFLVNDSVPGLSNNLEQLLAAEQYPGADIDIIRSDQDYLTVEENVKNNLLRDIDKLPDKFIVIGNSDRIDFAALGGALDFMRKGSIDLLLVGLNNCESWDNAIIRKLYCTPTLFYRKNALSRDNCYGPDVFGHTMLDYGPVDYLAYIGCQIYTKKFFRDLCAVQVREPLYSLPIGTLELTERGQHIVGFYHPVVLNRIDILSKGPDDGEHPPEWWVIQSRTKRGLSQHISMPVVSSSLGISSTAFTKIFSSQMVSIRRGEPIYVFWNYLSTIMRQFLSTFVAAQKDPLKRYAPSEVQDIIQLGARLETVDIGLPQDSQARVCSWLKRFHLTQEPTDANALREWLNQANDVFNKDADNRKDMGFWFVKRNDPTNG